MKAHVATVLVVFSALLAATPAFGMGGLLKEPSLSFSVPAATGTAELGKTKMPEPLQKLLNVLSDKKRKFVGGYFINWETHLYYAGDASQLDRFLDELAKAGGRIHLQLSKAASGTMLKLGDDVMQSGPAQWEVAHNSSLGDDRFDVTIYLGDGKIDVEKLHLELRSQTPK
jgi:hypothetical protein